MAEGIGRLRIAEEQAATPTGQLWKPKGYATAAGPAAAVEVPVVKAPEKEASILSKLFKGPLGVDFVADNNTFSKAQIRATFYPKFENEKSDQEVCCYAIYLLLLSIIVNKPVRIFS